MLNWLEKHLSLMGLADAWVDLVGVLLLTTLILFSAYLAYTLAKTILVKILYRILSAVNTRVSQAFLEFKVISRSAQLVPALVLYFSLPLILGSGYELGEKFVDFSQMLMLVYMVASLTLIIDSFLNAVHSIYNSYVIAKKLPIKTYTQVVKLGLYLFSSVFVISILLNKSPWGFFTGIGAAMAIILLVFKDLILGLAASVQVASYDMVRIGDWVTISKYSADGTVEEISLSTVKIRNFDKTVTTIPTYDLLASGLQNWRYMQEAGGRRIKRSINIDLHTIKFCTEEMLERFRKIELVKHYLSENIKENLPNVAVFREYVNEYLKANKHIHTDGKFIFMIRDLQPAKDVGLPMELYIFAKDTSLVPYERVQTDIVEHLLAALELFDLKALQR